MNDGLKLIVALAGGVEGDDDEALSFAAELCARHGAWARVVSTYGDAAGDLIAMGRSLGTRRAAEAIAVIERAEDERRTRIEALARSAAASRGVAFSEDEHEAGDRAAPRMAMTRHDYRPPAAAARATALADLVILGQGGLNHADPRGEVLGQALLQQLTPTMIARGQPSALSGLAAIAWDGGAQAGRAVRAALPLLAEASEVVILQSSRGLDLMAADPDARRLQTYLALHGITRTSASPVEGDHEGEALAAAARSRGAGLLVAGAYGRSRLREVVFGGATRSFLGDRDGPSLLLVH